jgi:HD-like signal output (HDOD) protein
MAESGSLQDVVGRLGDLPAMPELVVEVLRVTDDPESGMTEVETVIQKDPALTAKILRISNSPYYGMKQHVGSLKLALVILGVREVRNIVLGVSVFDTFRDSRADAVLAKDYWQHSFLVGALCKKLGSALGLSVDGESFIAGLLHDIGKLVLLRQLWDPYLSVYQESGGVSGPLCEAEQEVLGFTHCDAAMALAQQWNFPQTLAHAVRLHHPSKSIPLTEAKDPELAALVRMANLTGHAEIEKKDDEDPGTIEVIDEEAWSVLDKAPSPIAVEDRGRVLTDFLLELRDSPPPTF